MPGRVTIPPAGTHTLHVAGRDVRQTNLDKLFWKEEQITKGDLLQYYADVAPVLLPHIRDRAMVMKRYPHARQRPHQDRQGRRSVEAAPPEARPRRPA
ncbi:MAG: hypothetical protein H0W18_03550 [Acidobacteria bacterium]|nr:hypothetical protein [Acidobacteriota bacterium]